MIGRQEERLDAVEQEGQDSSTDCTLNNSLLDIQTMGSNSSSSRPLDSIGEECELGSSKKDPIGAIASHSRGSHGGSSKFSFSSFSKQLQSSSTATESKSHCCGQTAAETVASSNWSQVGGVTGGTRTTRPLSDVVANCLVCFWPGLYSAQERPHGDCFIIVDCTAGSEEEPDWHASYPYTPVVFSADSNDGLSHDCREKAIDEQVEVEDEKVGASTFLLTNKEPPSLPKLPISKVCHLNINVEEDKVCQTKLARLTPITVHSKASFTEYTKNGATMTSTLNTLHRRTDDISMGFFTHQTLNAIHSSPTEMNEAATTPRNQDTRKNAGANINRSAFQTPGNRARLDSETFRRTIKVVTCEKRMLADDSDVSPIDSDAGFSPIDPGTKQVSAESLQPPRQSPVTAQKKLAFEMGSVRRYETPTVPRALTTSTPSRNLFVDFASEPMIEHLSPLSEFGMSVMKSLQSIVNGKPSVPSYVHTTGYETDKENMPRNTPKSAVAITSSAPSSEEDKLRKNAFLQKSSSFLKALRRAGRSGKVLIQGWVAFRETVPWKEIIRNPKRCDFRYIILLDDMPILHMFRSRPKKKLMPKHDPIQNCISLDLTGDIALKASLASKDLGNEVCIFDQEAERYLFGLLPIPMPNSVFCDKHQSRLGKREVLKSVFEPFKRSVKFASSFNLNTSEKSGDLPATMEQYDVSRHLLFVLDCAIKFPLTNPGRPSVLYPKGHTK